VLLETVLATGLLITGLAVVGAQVQSADTTIRVMNRTIRAMMLAEQQMAELDMGLIQLDSLDEVEEGDFGPRHPDWGWLMTIEPTVVEQIYRLQLDVYYLRREGDYREDDFDYDAAKRIFTAWAFRAQPRPIDFGADLGLSDEELDEMAQKLIDTGIPGLDPSQFDPSLLAQLPFEDFITVLPTLLDAFGIEFDQLASALPKDVLDQLRESGALDELGAGDTAPKDDFDTNGPGGSQGPTGGGR
jgi:hypothetical protein